MTISFVVIMSLLSFPFSPLYFPLTLSLSPSLSPSLSTFLTLTVSALAFDQYGELSDQLEQESAMRERAETFATQVYMRIELCVYMYM